jgi:hypothetical protein
LGGDIALISLSRAGEVERGSVVWFHQDWSPTVSLQSMARRCAQAMHRARQQADLAGLSSLPLDGLLLLNGSGGSREVEVEQESIADSDCQIVAMRLPPDLHEHTEDVQAGVALLLEQLTQGSAS